MIERPRLPEPDGRGLADSTLAVHAGEDRLKSGNAVTDAIFCAATYTFPDTQSAVDYVAQKLPREEYGRYGNPSERITERNWRPWRGGRARSSIPPGWPRYAVS